MSDLRTELRAIHEARGNLTPRAVVEAARPKDSPLHAYVFDRPVKEAAEAYYLERARQLIRTVRREMPSDDPEDNRTVREYVAVRTDAPENGGFVYRPSEEVARDPIARRVVLREMEREWRDMRRRYSEFEEFTELVMAAAGELAGSAK